MSKQLILAALLFTLFIGGVAGPGFAYGSEDDIRKR